MTKQRDYRPGYVHKTTRRTFQRSFFLAPHDGVAEIFGYLLAFAANETGVIVSSATCMSNHYHATGTDAEAEFGEFQAVFNGLLARVLNITLERTDRFWDSGRPSVNRIVRPIDHVQQAVYVMANPVKAGLVATAAEWPGFMITPDMIGTTQTYKRPDHPFFRTGDGNTMPLTIDLRIEEPPDAVAAHGPGWFKAQVTELLALREAELQAHFNNKFLGATAAAAVDPRRQAKTPDDKGMRNCEIICGDLELLKVVLAALAEFRIQYKKALERLRRGDKKVRFPAGTYALRRYYGVKVDPPPDEPAVDLAA
jgi:hypothetical protein